MKSERVNNRRNNKIIHYLLLMPVNEFSKSHAAAKSLKLR
jgi:hypothetical protein